MLASACHVGLAREGPGLANIRMSLFAGLRPQNTRELLSSPSGGPCLYGMGKANSEQVHPLPDKESPPNAATPRGG